jgi:hypothetical protein
MQDTQYRAEVLAGRGLRTNWPEKRTRDLQENLQPKASFFRFTPIYGDAIRECLYI